VLREPLDRALSRVQAGLEGDGRSAESDGDVPTLPPISKRRIYSRYPRERP